MHDLIEFFKDLMNAEKLAALVTAYGGLYLVALIIFAETGLFVGFFLPGDSLLFVTGFMIANSLTPFESNAINVPFWIILISIAGIVGNSVGYWFGKKTGHLIFERKDTWLFKKKHIQDAHDFYEKKGGAAIILARFVPIIRTFAPIIAGVVDMDRKKFFYFNVLGSFLWVASMILSGYFLGTNEWVKHNFEKIVLGLIVVTTAPVIYKMFFAKSKPSPTVE
ncbi:MAG: VTT domain-containing protein [Chitinophagaceae bacterium]|nr:VTT domain-containing protein [Chitinophagaceae bacterium]